MSVMLLLALAAMQADGKKLLCGAPGPVRSCRGEDGSTYIERRIGERLVRKGMTSDGQSWTEYVTRNFDGWRLQGEDSRGTRWYQACSVRGGVRGTDRTGAYFVLKVGDEGCSF